MANTRPGVKMERRGRSDHSFAVHGELGGSFQLWALLEQGALSFLDMLKRELPTLEFSALLQVEYSYENDCFVPHLTYTLLSASDASLATLNLKQFVYEQASLIDGLNEERTAQ